MELQSDLPLQGYCEIHPLSRGSWVPYLVQTLQGEALCPSVSRWAAQSHPLRDRVRALCLEFCSSVLRLRVDVWASGTHAVWKPADAWMCKSGSSARSQAVGRGAVMCAQAALMHMVLAQEPCLSRLTGWVARRWDIFPNFCSTALEISPFFQRGLTLWVTEVKNLPDAFASRSGCSSLLPLS